MALIKCPECGKVFSNRAAHCPQCGLPTVDALEMITEGQTSDNVDTPEVVQDTQPVTADIQPTTDNVQQTIDKVTEDNGQSSMSSPLGGVRGGSQSSTPGAPQPYYVPRYEEPEPKKQRNLLTYVLIVAVIVLAIVCVALVITTSGALNGTPEEEDTVAVAQQLPPDTTPARVEAEPEAKPIIRSVVEEEVLPEATEEIEIEATPQNNQPAPAEAPAPEPQPATAE